MQDFNYVFDPVGDVANVTDNTQQTVCFRNTVVDPSSDYDSDPPYRVTRAARREHFSLISGRPNAPAAPTTAIDFNKSS